MSYETIIFQHVKEAGWESLRFILQILEIPLRTEKKKSPKLVDSIFLEKQTNVRIFFFLL